jgi:hypothetical protein
VTVILRTTAQAPTRAYEWRPGRDTPVVHLEDWRWNRETHRWELVESGDEYTGADAVSDVALLSPSLLAVVVGVGLAILRVAHRRWSRRPAVPGGR